MGQVGLPTASQLKRGAISMPIPASAMVVTSRDGGPYFDREVPLKLYFVPRESIDGHRFLRMELKSNDANLTRGYLAVALHPYATGFFGHSIFRGPSRKGRRDADWSPDESSATSWECISHGRSSDPFETSRAKTAGLDRPRAFAPREGLGRTRSYNPTAWVFGFMADYPAVLEQVHRSKAVAELRRMTKERTLRFDKVPGGAPEVRLHEEIIEDCLTILTMIAVPQALAGPNADSELWRGRPVTRLVDKIYRKHVNNLNRWHLRQVRRMVSRQRNQ